MVEPTASLTELVSALEQKQVSATELLETYLDRVERLDGPINSVVTIEADRARSEAKQIDQDRSAGNPVGALAGVPITIKDALATQGIRSTGGATELVDFVPETDAVAVAKVRHEGAVVFGKTNIPRWSGDYQSFNEIFGTTSNPWNLDCTPGGSSGGPAAAVAMGFTGFEIGTDIGGSIRLPSAYCGVYGHKPSFGIIPTFGYLDSVNYHRNTADVNVFGPIARSLDDLELLLGLLAGPNPDDTPGWKLELPPPRAAKIGDFRVAAWLDDELSPVDRSVLEVMTSAVEALAEAGANIDHDRRPDIDPQKAAIDGGILISSATDVADSDQLDAPYLDALQGMPHRVWDVRNRQRGQIRQRWAEFFSDIDILLCPVAPTPAFNHLHSTDGSNWAHGILSDYGDLPYRKLLHWNSMIGSAYLPVTVPPIGRTDSGLPVGIQVVAPYLGDRTALAFARCMAQVIGGYVPPPAAT